jgi:hypothetical protein
MVGMYEDRWSEEDLDDLERLNNQQLRCCARAVKARSRR